MLRKHLGTFENPTLEDEFRMAEPLFLLLSSELESVKVTFDTKKTNEPSEAMVFPEMLDQEQFAFGLPYCLHLDNIT